MRDPLLNTINRQKINLNKLDISIFWNDAEIYRAFFKAKGKQKNRDARTEVKMEEGSGFMT